MPPKCYGHCSIQVLLSSLEIIVQHIVYLARKTFQRPENSQGMFSQEWAAIRTICV